MTALPSLFKAHRGRACSDDRAKWNRKYADAQRLAGMQPPQFLRECTDAVLAKLPQRPLTLDVAAGSGRNSLYLAEMGCRVLAVDFALAGLIHCQRRARERGLAVYPVAMDLQTFSFPSAYFDLIINFFYLERALFAAMAAALKPGGILLFETYTSRYAEQNPERAMRQEFLLAPGELRQAFSGLEILMYQETETTARLMARRGGDALA